MAVFVHTPLTVDEFSRLSRDEARHEMNAGELITMPPPKYLHSRIAMHLCMLLAAELREEGSIEVLCEAGFVLFRSPLTIRQPDFSLVNKERTMHLGSDEYIEGAPDLAVEIVSPSDSAQDLEMKIGQYFAAGAKLVWILYPQTKTVHVCSSTYKVFRISETETLTGGDLLPGFSLPVAHLFA